jgi:hypothetical protein
LDANGLTLPENLMPQEARSLWPEHDGAARLVVLVFLQPLWCSTKPPLLARLQANKLTFKACANFVIDLTAKRCCPVLIDRRGRIRVLVGAFAAPTRSRAFVFVLLEMPGRSRCTIAMPNVRAKRAPTAGRQARAGENVHRTTGPGLVAYRWCSA